MSKFDKVIGYEDIKAEGRLCEMANELFNMANVSKKDTKYHMIYGLTPKVKIEIQNRTVLD